MPLDEFTQETGEVVFALREALGKQGIEHFLKIVRDHGRGDACWMDGGIPHPVHFREGTQVRNLLRSITGNKWSAHQYDDRWVALTEAAIAEDPDKKEKFRFRNPIVSRDGVEVFVRYKLLETRFLNIYVHNIRRADGDKNFHDHPWSFVTFLLWGGYEENSVEIDSFVGGSVVVPKKRFTILRGFNRFKFNKASVFHQLRRIFGSTWTLVVTGVRFREWGYYVPEGGKDNYWIQNTIYRRLKRENKLPVITSNSRINGE